MKIIVDRLKMIVHGTISISKYNKIKYTYK